MPKIEITEQLYQLLLVESEKKGITVTELIKKIWEKEG